MTAVGLLRWGLCRQREETRILLSGRGIDLSPATVSNLAEDCLLRCTLLHQRLAPVIVETLAKRPARVLHLDGTQEKGSRVVFTIRDELSGIVLASGLLTAESEDEIAAFLEEVKERFGWPDIVVRDMSTAIEKAVDRVFPGVPQQICHVHFLRALGDHLFAGIYPALRGAVLGTKVLARLLEFRRRLPAGEDPVTRALSTWVHLVVDHVNAPREGSADVPFQLPYYEIVRRVREMEGIADRMISWMAARYRHFPPLGELQEYLRRLREDPGVVEQYGLVDRLWRWYEAIRESFRLVRGEDAPGTTVASEEMDERLDIVEQQVAWMEDEAAARGGRFPRAFQVVREMLERHEGELFVRWEVGDRRELVFLQDNNPSERGHRWSRMRFRRMTGRGGTTREMVRYGPLLAVFENFFNRVYAEEVLAKVPSLAEALWAVPAEEVERLRGKLMAVREPESLGVGEEVREELLRDLPGLLEGGGDDLEATLRRWMGKAKVGGPTLL